MDAYEATRIVYSRIQTLDPDNAAKIMGLLLLQDHGEKEMIRLAFGPETLVHSIILKARTELGLLSPSTSRVPSTWAPSLDDTRQFEDLSSPPFYDEVQLQDQLSFLNDHGDDVMLPYGGNHRRSCSVADLYLGSEWKPCLYFARGYCKNGSGCRFQHGLMEDCGKVDAVVEQQCHELLLRSKSQRLMGSFPFSPTGSVPSPNSAKYMNFLLQQQQQAESQRAAMSAAAMMLGGDESKFFGRSRMDRYDYAGLVNPVSRQIYLTFPADSTFREEDVSNYFSIYGPVQDVRIPYQQKRMFGFVTFLYPETVKLILAKGNPHFVCDARVLVKPYKEKGKVPDKKLQQQQHQSVERVDFSYCSTPTGLDSRDPYDLQQLGARMLYNNNQEALLRRKLEEQQQAAELQQAIELQGRRFMGLQLLDLKTRNLSSLSSPSPIHTPTSIIPTTYEEAPPQYPYEDKCHSPVTAGDVTGADQNDNMHTFHHKAAVKADKEESAGGERNHNVDSDFHESVEHNLPHSPFASPTKSSFVGTSFSMVSDAVELASNVGGGSNHLIGPSFLPTTPSLDMTSIKSCLFQMPRFSSSGAHGAVGL